MLFTVRYMSASGRTKRTYIIAQTFEELQKKICNNDEEKNFGKVVSITWEARKNS